MAEQKGLILVDMGSGAGVQKVAYSMVDMYEKSDAAVEKAMGTIKAMADKTVTAVKSIPVSERPQKVSVEFGIKFDMEAGAVVAKASAEAAVKVTLSWEHKEQ